MAKSVLGKGLGALIPENDNSTSNPNYNEISNIEEKNFIKEVNISKLKPNMYQPRKTFNEDKLNELADSIKSKGILNPIIVREESGDNYQIIAGERRWRASKLIGLEKVPVIIQKVDNIEMLELAIIENIQRDDLNPLEEAESYQVLLKEFNLKHEEIAEKVGKSRANITNMLRILKLSYEIKEGLKNKLISMGHARALLGLKNENLMLKLYKLIIEEKLSVRETEKKVKDLNTDKILEKKIKKKKIISPEITNLENNLMDYLGTKVNIKDKNSKGQIVIDYYSLDDFERIMDKMGINETN